MGAFFCYIRFLQIQEKPILVDRNFLHSNHLHHANAKAAPTSRKLKVGAAYQAVIKNLDHIAIRQNSAFFNDYNTVFYRVQFVI